MSLVQLGRRRTFEMLFGVHLRLSRQFLFLILSSQGIMHTLSLHRYLTWVWRSITSVPVPTSLNAALFTSLQYHGSCMPCTCTPACLHRQSTAVVSLSLSVLHKAEQLSGHSQCSTLYEQES